MGIDIFSAKSGRCWCLVSFAIATAVLVPIAAAGVKWQKRVAIAQAMLGNETYSIDIDNGTIEEIRAAIPHLIAKHREAVGACAGSSMSDLTKMPAWNSRIKAWRGILMALRSTADISCYDYVDAFVKSTSATEEEVASVPKQAP